MTDATLTPRRILVVAQRPSDYVEMRRCAVAMQQFGWRSQVLYFHDGPLGDEEAKVAEDIERLRGEGTISDAEFLFYGRHAATDLDAAGGVGGAGKPKHWLRLRIGRLLRTPVGKRFWLAVKHVGRWVKFYDFLVLLYIVGIFRRNLVGIREALERLKPDAIILPEDIVGLVTPLVIKAGHGLNLPSVILPYTIANQWEAFRSLSGNPSYRYRYWPNRLVGRLFPRWVMREGATSLVRLPAPYILGHVLTDTVPPDPWMMNSGYANVIAVENDAMLDYYLAAGIPRSKMQVVGAIYDDHLARYKLDKERELAALRAEIGIDGTKPLFVVGGCPDQSQSCPPGFEFADMDDFTRRLADALKPLQEEYEVVVRPHPNHVRMGEVLAEHGLRTTMVDTARMIALADAYLAFASATIRWAVACAVPTINYDVFHYDYADFREVEGVINVDSYDGLCRGLQRLRPESGEQAALRAAIARSADRWGRLDGRSTRRIAELIDGLCRVERVPRNCY